MRKVRDQGDAHGASKLVASINGRFEEPIEPMDLANILPRWSSGRNPHRAGISGRPRVPRCYRPRCRASSAATRCAGAYKPDAEPLDHFIRRKGGTNECAARFTRWLGRGARTISRKVSSRG
jgi:hypothetical protein